MVKGYTFEEFVRRFLTPPAKKEKRKNPYYEFGRKMARESLEEAYKKLEREKRRRTGTPIGLSCIEDSSNYASFYSLKDAA